MCVKSARLGTFIGGLVHNIECRCEEHAQRLVTNGKANKFILIPEIKSEIWQKIMTFHPKTLVCTVAKRVKAGLQQKVS